VLALLLVSGVVYWLFILAEGAYLGSTVVCKLYDWTASKYEGIKQFDPFYEQQFLGRPLAYALTAFAYPLVLDVAAGTSRVSRALLGTERFEGRVVALDRARRMLVEGRRELGRGLRQVTMIQGDALRLPFADAVFDAATCLEALEFFPDIEGALGEMARVLRPDGVLFITNRKGYARYYMPGRVKSSAEMMELLERVGFERVRISRWQVNYDLVYARKSDQGTISAAEAMR